MAERMGERLAAAREDAAPPAPEPKPAPEPTTSPPPPVPDPLPTPEEGTEYRALLTAIVLSNGHQMRVTGVEIARAAGFTLTAPATVTPGEDAYLTVTARPEEPPA